MKKADPLIAAARISRRALTVATAAEFEKMDKEFWAQQTPQARMRALELMRRINYGEAAAGRLQRVLEIV